MLFAGTSLALKRFIAKMDKEGVRVTEEAGSIHLGRGHWLFRVRIEDLRPPDAAKTHPP